MLFNCQGAFENAEIKQFCFLGPVRESSDYKKKKKTEIKE